MEYSKYYTKFYTDVFDQLKVFDILTFQEIEKLYVKVNKILVDSGEWEINDSLNNKSFIKSLVNTPSGNKKYVFEKGSLSAKYKDVLRVKLYQKKYTKKESLFYSAYQKK